MIIEKITIKNWRGYREVHTFNFQNGINLLVGRNEAGKSTLFEALTRVFFDRHNSQSEEIRAIQPINSSLAPEAEIQFKANGCRYRAIKRFLQRPHSELYTERGGKWELDHGGDKADEHLRNILHGVSPNRTAARPEHRGLAHALWYLQSDSAIPEGSWNEGVRQGLQGLVQLAASSHTENRLLKRINDIYEEYWTPTGHVSTRSELKKLQTQLEDLEKTYNKLQANAQAIERHRQDLEAIQREEAIKESELIQVQEKLKELDIRLKEADALEKKLEINERALNDSRQKAHKLRDDLTQIELTQKKINELRAEAKRLEDELTNAVANTQVQAAAIERYKQRLEKELQPALKEIDSKLRALKALKNLRIAETTRELLKKHLQEVANIRQQLDTLKKERTALIAPTVDEMKKFEEAIKKLSNLEAQIEASAVRVSFEWTGQARKVETHPSTRLTEQGEYLVAEPTEFDIEGVGKVRVRSGADSLKDLLEKRNQLDQHVQQLLKRFGVSDAEGMAALHQRGRDLDKQKEELSKNLTKLEKSEPDAEAKLARLQRDIEAEMQLVRTLPVEVQDLGIHQINLQIEGNEKERQRLDNEISFVKNEQQNAEKNHEKFQAAKNTIEIKLATLKAEIKSKEDEITKILQNYGTVDQLRELIAQADEKIRSQENELNAFKAEFDQKVNQPREEYKDSQNRLRDLEQELNELRYRKAERIGAIESSVQQGNYSQLADIEIKIAWCKQRLEVLKRRADGAKLLRNLVLSHQNQRFEALSGPIQELLNPWLKILTDEKYHSLQIDTDLKPTAVNVSNNNAELPLSSLSYGTKEQIVVLLRLAMAITLSQNEPNLVVIDDRLVNADPVRMERFREILQEAAKHCQVVIATCNDTPYAGLNAHIIRVPTDGIIKKAEIAS